MMFPSGSSWVFSIEENPGSVRIVIRFSVRNTKNVNIRVRCGHLAGGPQLLDNLAILDCGHVDDGVAVIASPRV